MPLHPLGFEASIQVEGDEKTIEEFKVQNEDNCCSCYIPCQTGKRFKIQFTDHRLPSFLDPPLDLVIFFKVDGEDMECLASYGPIIPSTPTVVSRGKASSPTAYQAYQFADVKLSEDESECTFDDNVLKQLGSIVIEVYRGRTGLTKPRLWKPEDKFQQKTFHEKSKKAAMISNQVQLSEELQWRQPQETIAFEYEDYSPHAKIVFYYRSRDILELDNIIPFGDPSVSQSAKLKPEKLRKMSIASAFASTASQGARHISLDNKPNLDTNVPKGKRQIIDVDELDLGDTPSSSSGKPKSRKKRKSGKSYDFGNDGLEFVSARKKDSRPVKTEKGADGRDVILLDDD